VGHGVVRALTLDDRRVLDTLVLESGPKDDVIPHARRRCVTVPRWTPEIPTHFGRWETTPMRAPLQEVLATLVQTSPGRSHRSRDRNGERSPDVRY
jgi:hypothetical protein